MPLYVSFFGARAGKAPGGGNQRPAAKHRRGINVGGGGHKKIKMSDLRQFYESLGLGGVRTILQSGNVVFRTDENNLRDVRRRIEAGILDAFGFEDKIPSAIIGEARKHFAI